MGKHMRKNMKSLMKTTALAIALVGFAVAASGSALASAGAPPPPAQKWSFSGMFGTFDRGSAQRGLQVYREVCASCHSLRLIHYRHLSGLGYTEDQIEAMAAENEEVKDGPNLEGEMFERVGIPADKFPSPFPNALAAAAAHGSAPPDLSLMVKARKGGADYLYGILTGYMDPPSDFEMAEDGNYNKYFPGHVIAMAPPLSDDAVEYQDGTKATMAQMSHDVTTFLAWAAEPELEARKSMGIKVLLFLIIFTGLLYRVKKKVWEDVH